MKLSKYYPFLFGLFGFPIQVLIGNVFDFLNYIVFLKDLKWKFKLLGTICKYGEYYDGLLPHLILSSLLLPLIFALPYLIKNKNFRYFFCSYLVFISFGLFIIPLPNDGAIFLLRALFLNTQFIQILSHFVFSIDYILFLLPLLFSYLLIKRMQLNKEEIILFLSGSFMSLIGSFLFFWGMQYLVYS